MGNKVCCLTYDISYNFYPVKPLVSKELVCRCPMDSIIHVIYYHLLFSPGDVLVTFRL